MQQKHRSNAGLAIVAAAAAIAARQVTVAQLQQAGPVDDLETAVAAIEGTAGEARNLIVEFAKYVAAHANDPVKLKELADRILAANTATADTVAANPDPDPTD